MPLKVYKPIWKPNKPDKPQTYLCEMYDHRLEPVILMSPEQISVIPNLARIKFGPYQISKNGPNRQYRNIFDLGQIWNNQNLFRTQF